ncbi:glycosyltransferase [Leifsonia sp. Root112D2]|uniref:glycosyltransferase n=1 Tax=Leifsonia sp. Root112D2 TaxID=1736426 RepID=UPI0006F3A02E|nr:glycosyltransferase [Leifsonia sp. Root112D2]KQV06027.1 hypothetical protein ASC63_00550 [Leifsonia sp. Root112D2]
MIAEPAVDVVIAVHDPSRAVDRAVRSVFDAVASVRVTVVCHGIEAHSLTLDPRTRSDERLRLVEFADGIRSPAGPFNHGLSLASAQFVSIMGSDDFLEPGAIGGWLAEARSSRADMVMAPVRMQNGEPMRAPLVRPWRQRGLNAVKDRLFYRSAPLGLIRRALVEERQLVLTEGLRSGEDLAVSARLYSDAIRISLPRSAPRYVVGMDAQSRVTTAVMSVSEALAAIDDLLAREWVQELSRSMRRALGIKLLRTHLLNTALARPTAGQWDAESLSLLRRCATEVVRFAPAALIPLCRADRRLLGVILAPVSDAQALVEAISARSRSARIDTVLPNSVLHAFDRESVLVRYLLYALKR